MVERVRQQWSGPVSTDYLSKQAEFGWRLVSIEWEREITAKGPAAYRGLRTRSGEKWATGQIFELLPRIIDAGPRLLPSEEWVARREQLFAAAF